MKKTIVLVLLALIVGVGAAVFVASRDADNGANESATQEETGPLGVGQQTELGNGNGDAAEAEQVVVYTDDGFEPAETTIQAGETVEFINQSSGDMHPASDPHPQHTDLPDFDARGRVAPGESYSFTFNEPGQWGYHDHLRSFQTGTVIVE